MMIKIELFMTDVNLFEYRYYLISTLKIEIRSLFFFYRLTMLKWKWVVGKSLQQNSFSKCSTKGIIYNIECIVRGVISSIENSGQSAIKPYLGTKLHKSATNVSQNNMSSIRYVSLK